ECTMNELIMTDAVIPPQSLVWRVYYHLPT
ncbi:hypothetical protein D046_7250, partial [Vibrio parahaemolyticus V-223/04]